MKPVAAALAAAMLLWPPCAHAQGYSGVMSPQQGYHPPPAAANNGAQQGNGMGDPYGGTGANTATGYASMMQGNGGDQATDMAVMEPQTAQPDGAAARTGSAYERAFAPKDQDDLGDGTDGVSIYDTVNDNSLPEAERRRQAILRKIDADQKKAQHDIDIANQQRDDQIRATVQKTVRDQWKKDHPGDDSNDDDDQSGDGAADQGAQ